MSIDILNKQTDSFPIKLTSTRAWRTYLGGKLLDEFYGNSCEDGHFPEEWISSLVEARNAGREHILEGLSHLAADESVTLKELVESDPKAYFGEEWYEKFGATMGVLVKIIDSSERLTIQVHPDRQKAMELFNSQYGKTECWHILGGRTIDGEEPCIYLGFKPGVTREQWQKLFSEQDISGMLDAMHKFPVKAGDTILIEGGIPHAIGSGCMLVEIQEPTDYTIRVEKTTPSGLQVADKMCHQGLGFDLMFDCFHYDGLSAKETKEKWFLKGSTDFSDDACKCTTLVGYKDTPFFNMNLLEISAETTLTQRSVCSSIFVLDGEGKLAVNNKTVDFKKGDQFFVPANVSEIIFKPDSGCNLKLFQCFGPSKGESKND